MIRPGVRYVCFDIEAKYSQRTNFVTITIGLAYQKVLLTEAEYDEVRGCMQQVVIVAHCIRTSI